MLEYIEPAPLKNYKSKGYQPLIDEHTNLMDKFEEKDQPPSTFVSKSELKAKLKKEKIIENIKR